MDHRSPAWLEILEAPGAEVPLALDDGETAVIALALTLRADLLLMDERRGVRAAQRKGLRVTGTLGVLDLAAERGLIDFGDAIDKLERTSFRRPQALLDALRKKHG